MFKKRYLLFVLLSLASLTVGQELTQAVEANTAPSDAYDCTIVALDTVDESSLTKVERIAQMDASLVDSIDKHYNCIDQVVSNNAASTSGQGAGAGEVGAAGESVKGEDAEGENGTSDEQSENATEQTNNEDATNKRQDNDKQTAGNGAKNQDIAVTDNDSAVCRLLKDELKIETDPKKQADLKEIYHNYKCRG
jgi:hypothetical protein